MHPSGDRLKIRDVERKRPQMTIPADDIERVMVIDKTRHLIPSLDSYFELAGLILGDQLIGRPDVTFAIG